MHTVTFAVKQRNVDRLHDVLMDVSDPSSPNYGKHWSRQRVGKFTANKVATKTVKAALEALGAQIDSTTRYGEYIKATAPVALWESFFNAQFHVFHDELSDQRVLRALEYSLPAPLAAHVHGVFGVADYAVDLNARASAKNKKPLDASPLDMQVDAIGNNGDPWCQQVLDTQGQPYYDVCVVYPQLLYKVYNSSAPYGSAPASQAIFGSLGQSFEPQDLADFQAAFGLLEQPIAGAYNGHVFYNACVASTDNCDEASLDVQYITSMAQGVPTFYDYVEETSALFTDWIYSVADMAAPADVFSISYLAPEMFQSASSMASFNTEAMKLGLQGVTIINSSGDDGAPGNLVSHYDYPCGYYAAFPSVSPYVLSLGATQGPEYGQPEVTCQVPASVITSGGGFSAAFDGSGGLVNPTPSYQAAVVSAYLASHAASVVSGYGGGRGYPDLSLLGNNYLVRLNGSFDTVSGTSASTPAFAGVVSQANAVRKAAGRSALGFVNPLVYQYAAAFTRDVTVGENNCTSASGAYVANDALRFTATCCAQGFSAAAGWDPVTGLGSVDVDRFVALAASLGNSSAAPTAAPTQAPAAVATMAAFALSEAAVAAYPSWLAMDATGDVLALTNDSTAVRLANVSSQAAFPSAAWRATVPSGNDTYCVSLDDSGARLFAGGYATAFFSNDSGASWQPSTLMAFADEVLLGYAYASADGRVVLTGAESFALLSTDGGLHFDAVVPEVPPQFEIFGAGLSPSGAVVAIGTSTLVNVSADGGQTWHTATGFGPEAGEPDYAHLVVGDATLYAAAYFGTTLYRSDDQGRSFSAAFVFDDWIAFVAASADMARVVVVLDAGDAQPVLVSDDFGASFTPLALSAQALAGGYAEDYGLLLDAQTNADATVLAVLYANGRVGRATIAWAAANATATPSAAPSASPSAAPSTPTATTVAPTAAPTLVPTAVAPASAAPTAAPTTPVAVSTVAPSAAPTAAPTTQTSPVLTFSSTFNLDGVVATATTSSATGATSYALSAGQVASIAAATAASMGLAPNSVVLGSYVLSPVGGRRALLAASPGHVRAQDTTAAVAVNGAMETATSVLLGAGQDAQATYDALAAALVAAIDDSDDFVALLRAYGAENDVAASFATTTAANAQSGDPVVVDAAAGGGAQGLSRTTVVGVALGTVAVAAVLALLGYALWRHLRATRGKDEALAKRVETEKDAGDAPHNQL